MHAFRKLMGGLAAGVLAALAASPVQAAELRFAGPWEPGHSSALAMTEQFAPKLAELTNGELTATIFPNTLGGPAENVDQVRTGAILGTWLSTAYLSRTVPELEAISLPFVYPDRESAFRIIDGPIGDLLNEKLAAQGFTALGYMELGFRQVTNNVRPITKLEDFAGLKIRLQPNETHLATFRALGAAPVSMGYQEVYSALQQGVIDGQENPYSVILVNQYQQVQKYLSDTGHFFDLIIVVVNKANFEAMPAEQQQAIREAMNQAIAWQRERVKADEEAAIAKLSETMQFDRISDEERARLKEAAFKEVIDGLKQRIGADVVDAVLQEAAK